MKRNFLFLLALFFSALILPAEAQIITTIAGIGTQAFSGDSDKAISAGLDIPVDVALDGSGNYYITDAGNNRIRKVNAAGIITTIAGTGTAGYNGDDIPAITAELHSPAGITCDHSGNVYFTDAYNDRVRKINVTTGIITTVAGNGIPGYNGDNIQADSAELYAPHAIAFDAEGNLYISDFENNRIRKVNVSGIISTIAGTGVQGYTGDNGQAIIAEINLPYGIAVKNDGSIYFSDYVDNVVRRIDASGMITTFAGLGTGSDIGDNGPADAARFANPAGVAIDKDGNLYIADVYNARIRMVSASSGIITTVAGDGTLGYSGDNGMATLAELDEPTGVSVDGSGNLYIADFGNDRIRLVGWPARVNKLPVQVQKISVYPNPSLGTFTMNISSQIPEQVNVAISNILGETVKEFTVITNSPTLISLDQPDGIYYLSAIGRNGVWCEKIIVSE